MTTNEARTCECGCGREAMWSKDFGSDLGVVHMCKQCAGGGYPRNGECGWSELVREHRRSRSQPAQLEALEFVAPRNFTFVGLGANSKTQIQDGFRMGQQLRFAPYANSNNKYPPGTWWNGTYCFHPDDVPRIHAELCQLRDTPASHPPTGRTAAEVANPLKGLAEAFRELCECFCADCETICPPHRMAAMEETCVYCYQNNIVQTGDGDMGRICEWPKGYGIDRIASVAPSEARRHPADWDAWSTPGWES